ncbi:JAB domain-containing protein [Paraflavisolibacter sp. H34]|uniref:JAB domain-containing protein n=1 Tax=Huijunlia imazamoxiresistens TaxID=3127457 RepID=UPI003018B7DA
MKKQLVPCPGFQVSEIELVYTSKVKASQRPQIATSSDAYDLFVQHWEEGKMDLVEHLKVLFLNCANKVLAIFQVSTGGFNSTLADVRIIFTAALKIRSQAMILCHNHPSGNTKPSRQDEELTRKLKEGGKLLDIKILDHLIISSEGYFSFADEGLL